MPKVMLRRSSSGSLVFYVAKKDLEAEVASVEFDRPDKWGGELVLDDGSRYFVEPFGAPPKLPVTVQAQRLSPVP